MSREVFALTGGATPPPLVPEASVNKGYKEKRKISDKKVSWVWKPIVHPARPEVDRDKPFLSHWVKAGEEDVEYPWAKFNKKLAIPKYTDEQYKKYFQDNDWTREETDALFDLCEQFDLRFIVIHDRFPNPRRTIEDLKDRYYSITRQLLSLQLKPEALAQHPVFRYPFNKAQETERKEHYEKLYRRTKAQIEEEEMLIEEMKKIEKAQKKLQADRQKVAKLTQSIIAMPGTEPLPPPLEPPTKRRKKSITNELDLPGGTLKRKAAGSGVGARTPVKINAASVSLRTAQKVEAILGELGIVPSLTATTATAKAYNDLRQDIVILLDLQGHLEKKEFEVSVLEKQKRDLLALDLLAAHRDSFAQGRRKRAKKRKLDDDAEYEPSGDIGGGNGLATSSTMNGEGSMAGEEEDTPWKKTVGRRGSSRRLSSNEPSTPTTPAPATPSTPAAAKPRRGRGRPRLIKKELEAVAVPAAEEGSSSTTAFDDDMKTEE